MVYLIAIPSLWLTVHMWLYLSGLRTHDQVLFRFCDLRREVTTYLFENRDTVSEKEYADARLILNLLNTCIHFYNDLKMNVFNIRKLKQIAINVSHVSGQMERIKRSENAHIKGFVRKFEIRLVNAFFAHTPFLKTEIVFNLVTALLKLMVRSGRESFSKNALDFLTAIKQRSTPAFS